MPRKLSTGQVALPGIQDIGCATFAKLDAKRQQWDKLARSQTGAEAKQSRAEASALLLDLAAHRQACPVCSAADAAQPKAPSAAKARLVEAAELIYGEDPAELRYLHVVLAQCGLPYREVDVGRPFYEKTNGRTSLVLTPGVLLDPQTRRPTMQGIPYGAKPRLLMIHLCTAAKLQKTPEVEIAHSMSAFMRDLGLSVTGGKTGSIARFKEQLNRLAATRMQLLFQDDDKVSMLNPSPPIQRYDVWFPKSPDQKMLWPTTVTLGRDFFESLMSENALPLDARAIRALQQSAMALDVYTWLAHRLCRIPANRPAVISWDALQIQFGPEYASSKKFRDDFRETMRRVQSVYRAAKVGQTDDGRLELRHSSPPVARRLGAPGKHTQAV